MENPARLISVVRYYASSGTLCKMGVCASLAGCRFFALVGVMNGGDSVNIHNTKKAINPASTPEANCHRKGGHFSPAESGEKHSIYKGRKQ